MPCQNMSLGIRDSKGPDQLAHLLSLIKAFAIHKQNNWILKNVTMESKCPDETLRVCRVGCSEDVMYLTSLGCSTDIGLQLGKAC